MTALNSQAVGVDGLDIAFVAAAAGGDTAPVGDRRLLAVKNADVSAVTVTIVVPGNLPTGDPYPDNTVTVAAGATSLIPLLPLYRDKTDQRAHITYSSATSVTVAALSV